VVVVIARTFSSLRTIITSSSTVSSGGIVTVVTALELYSSYHADARRIRSSTPGFTKVKVISDIPCE